MRFIQKSWKWMQSFWRSVIPQRQIPKEILKQQQELEQLYPDITKMKLPQKNNKIMSKFTPRMREEKYNKRKMEDE